MIRVSMTETVTYDIEFTDEHFAELLSIDPDKVDVRAEILALIDNDPCASFGIEGAHDLLDAVLEASGGTVSVTDRDWDFEVLD